MWLRPHKGEQLPSCDGGMAGGCEKKVLVLLQKKTPPEGDGGQRLIKHSARGGL